MAGYPMLDVLIIFYDGLSFLSIFSRGNKLSEFRSFFGNWRIQTEHGNTQLGDYSFHFPTRTLTQNRFLPENHIKEMNTTTPVFTSDFEISSISSLIFIVYQEIT